MKQHPVDAVDARALARRVLLRMLRRAEQAGDATGAAALARAVLAEFPEPEKPEPKPASELESLTWRERADRSLKITNIFRRKAGLPPLADAADQPEATPKPAAEAEEV